MNRTTKQFHLDMAMDTTLQLKSDVAELKSLKNDVAELKSLKSDVAELKSLKNDVAELKSLKNDVAELKSLKNDVAELRKDLQFLQLTFKSYKLTDYQKKKEDGTRFTFPPFYSHPRGYHMALGRGC